jgi:hypothetical protein
MELYTVIRFNTSARYFKIQDTFPGTEIDNVKYYLIQMAKNDRRIFFKFDTYILEKTLAELHINPIVSSNGRLLTGLKNVNIYADPTVTDEGAIFYQADPDSNAVEWHDLTLTANTAYLFKIFQKDLNYTTI